MIFAFMPAFGGDEREALLLAASLRARGGALAHHPLWVLLPGDETYISSAARQELLRLDARLVCFQAPDAALHFPFGAKVFAAAAAEALAEQENQPLAWMDADTVILQEPQEFLLPAGKELGYRPVMLKNISSLYDQPLDRFWELVYSGCNTPPEWIFLMLTGVDGVRIRPHFNAGLLVVRPQNGLLRLWQENFLRLFQDPAVEEFYQRHILYRIFIHQAVLAGSILACLKPDTLQELSEKVNYPIFLQPKMPPEKRVISLNELVTFRYDEFAFFEHQEWPDQWVIEPALKEWLVGQITFLLQK